MFNITEKYLGTMVEDHFGNVEMIDFVSYTYFTTDTGEKYTSNGKWIRLNGVVDDNSLYNLKKVYLPKDKKARLVVDMHLLLLKEANLI